MTQIPAMVCVYGASGSGKTTDCGYSFPNALFIATPGALQSITHTCGYTPASIDVPDIQSATKALLDVKDKGYDAIVVDDFSFLAEKTISILEKRYKGFSLWGELRDVTLEFRNAARYCGVHVILNCWEQARKNRTDGTFVRGGPLLSGKLPEQLPAMCDLVLRCGRHSQRKPWTGIYRCEHSLEFVMKDRFGVCYDLNPIPMNLAEILRSVGCTVSRHKSLDWQEEIVEEFSKDLASGAPQEFIPTVEKLYKGLVDKGIDPKHARWTIRDVLDRTVIRKSLSTRSQSFFGASSNGLGSLN